ncbi:hypothetical protein WJX73_002902 [Symbiochloris irregularis]|uniref:Uncharacterized protein n=1 Tax=Symbiochloris irregularis TaxID=706552 RepID=A0AAW1PQ82_9CHLO
MYTEPRLTRSRAREQGGETPLFAGLGDKSLTTRRKLVSSARPALSDVTNSEAAAATAQDQAKETGPATGGGLTLSDGSPLLKSLDFGAADSGTPLRQAEAITLSVDEPKGTAVSPVVHTSPGRQLDLVKHQPEHLTESATSEKTAPVAGIPDISLRQDSPLHSGLAAYGSVTPEHPKEQEEARESAIKSRGSTEPPSAQTSTGLDAPSLRSADKAPALMPPKALQPDFTHLPQGTLADSAYPAAGLKDLSLDQSSPLKGLDTPVPSPGSPLAPEGGSTPPLQKKFPGSTEAPFAEHSTKLMSPAAVSAAILSPEKEYLINEQQLDNLSEAGSVTMDVEDRWQLGHGSDAGTPQPASPKWSLPAGGLYDAVPRPKSLVTVSSPESFDPRSIRQLKKDVKAALQKHHDDGAASAASALQSADSSTTEYTAVHDDPDEVSSELCSGLRQLDIGSLRQGEPLPLRGLPPRLGRHTRFADDGSRVDSPQRPTLRGVAPATGSHVRFDD